MREQNDESDVKYQNTRKPTDTPEGHEILEEMNSGHHFELSEWGMAHLDFEPGFSCLDIGCGGGANVERMLRYCPEGRVCGVDYSHASVEHSSEHNSEAIAAGRCQIEEGDVAALPFDDDSFDVITAYETLYFWTRIDESFSEILRVTRPGGSFMVCNEADGLNDDAAYWVSVIDGMTVYTAEQIVDFMEAAGFVDIEVDGDPERAWIAVVGHKAEA